MHKDLNRCILWIVEEACSVVISKNFNKGGSRHNDVLSLGVS